MVYGPTNATLLPAAGGLTFLALNMGAPDWFQILLAVFLVSLSVYGFVAIKIGEHRLGRVL